MGRMRFQDKVALVTGAATGIGRAVVQGLVDEGARVCFSDLNAEQGQALAATLNGRAMYFRSDATDEAQVRKMMDDVVDQFGRLDVAVNNVGNMDAKDQTNVRLHECSSDGWEGTLALSLKSNFYCMKYELMHMLAQGGGVIANAASTAGVIHAPLATAAYHAAKAGVIHLTELAAAQYAGTISASMRSRQALPIPMPSRAISARPTAPRCWKWSPGFMPFLASSIPGKSPRLTYGCVPTRRRASPARPFRSIAAGWCADNRGGRAGWMPDLRC